MRSSGFSGSESSFISISSRSVMICASRLSSAIASTERVGSGTARSAGRGASFFSALGAS